MSDSIDSSKATDWREGRRLRAFELKQEGWSQQNIARALGVGKGAVSQWMKRAREGGGKEALRKRSSPGAAALERRSARQALQAVEEGGRCAWVQRRGVDV
jgi:transposase